MFSEGSTGILVGEGGWWWEYWRFWELGDGFGSWCCAEAVEVEEEGEEAGHECVEEIKIG